MRLEDIKRISDLLKITEIVMKSSAQHLHLRFWYRGQPTQGKSLLPKVYRPGFAEDENSRLTKERHLAQDFRVLSAGMRTENNMKDADLYFLQQHYGMPTRLLDWTTSPLAALFFALGQPGKSKHEVETDGELFLMDAYEYGNRDDRTFGNGGKFNGIATSAHPVFTEAIRRIAEWNDGAQFPEFVIPVRPDHLDRRVSLQRSCFTFHVDGEPLHESDDESTSVWKCTIPKNAKPRLRRQLSHLGIDALSIFGDLDHLAETIKANYGVN